MDFKQHISSIIILFLLLTGIVACAGPDSPGQLQAGLDSLPASIASTTLDPATQRTPPTADAKFTRLSLDNGLSQSTVTCILQDDYGFIWLGTLDGLNKYDGHKFIFYRHDPDHQDSLSGNTINAIIQDRQGQLWIGTNNGLNRYDRSTDGFLRFQNDPRSVYSLSGNDVTSIFEDSNGTLWVGTTSGLNRYDPQRRRFTRYEHDPAQPESLIDDRVQAIAEYPVGTIWIGTPEGLDEFNPSQMTFQHYQFDLIDRFSLSSPDVRDLLVIGDQLWVATYGGGLNLWIPQFKRFERYEHQPNFPWTLSDNRVWDLAADGDGLLWIATEGGVNVLRTGDDRFIRITHDPLNPQSLSSNRVRSIYEDRGGVLWIGSTGSGLSLTDRYAKAFEHVRYDPSNRFGLQDNNVLSLYEDEQEVVWVGTDGGLTGFNPRTGAVIRYTHNPLNPNSLSGNRVIAIYQDRQEALWIGTTNGLDRFERRNGTFRHFQTELENPESLSSNSITAIKEDAWGIIWIGTSAGLNRFDPDSQRFQRIYIDPDDPNSDENSITDLMISADGLLWIATDGGGLYRINRDGEVIDHYLHSASDADSLTYSRLTSLHMDRQNRLWVGTIEGLNVFNSADRIFLRIRSSNGLPNDTINCILEDNQGSIWVSTNRGLASISSDLKTFRTYTIHDGIQSNEFSHACAQGHQGTLYFGGINGYNAFQPDQIKDNPIAPPVVLTSLTQGGELLGSDPAVEDETDITLTWPDTFFEFEFSALSYSQPQANQYAYRLAEFDEGWNLIGNRHFGRYTNLPPGDFTLELAASNHDGVWSEPINSLVVHVVPPFWQTWWFRIGVTGLLVITIFTSYRLRVRNIELRSRELEQQVDERTREIEERRQQLEALYRADDEMYRYLELESVLHALVNIAVDVLHADKSAVWLWNESHDRLTLHVSRGLRMEDGWPPDLDPGDEGIESALRRGEIVSAVRFQEKQADDLPDSPLLRQMLEEGVCSYLHLPVHIEEQVFAVFSVCYTSKHDFTAEDLRLFEALTKRAGVAIENARLYEQTQEIAVMEERNRLARDLHDAVTQTLFSASLIAEALPDLWNQDPEEGKTLLGELRNLSRGALAEMRSLLLELRPTALLESNLGDLLNQLAEAAKSKQGLPVAVQIDGECKLPPEVHISLYRIAQEGLNNAIKHSQASEVRINLQCSQDQEAGTTCARLTVQDNGLGFDPAHVSPDRLGLHILNERAQAIGAQIEITSELGQGTAITVNWEGDFNV